MIGRKKDKKTSRNSMMNTVSNQAKNTTGLFKGIINGIKETYQILKEGPKPNQKTSPITTVVGVLAIVFIFVMLILSIFSFGR